MTGLTVTALSVIGLVAYAGMAGVAYRVALSRLGGSDRDIDAGFIAFFWPVAFPGWLLWLPLRAVFRLSAGIRKP